MSFYAKADVTSIRSGGHFEIFVYNGSSLDYYNVTSYSGGNTIASSNIGGVSYYNAGDVITTKVRYSSTAYTLREASFNMQYFGSNLN